MYYLVEDLAGAEDEAGARKLHVLGAHVGMAQPRMRLGQKCDRLGRRGWDVTAKNKAHPKRQEGLCDLRLTT